MNTFSSIWESLTEAYYGAFDLIVANILWFIFTLLIITAPPAAAGLYYTSNQLVHGELITLGTFFEGFRKYFWLSYRWAVTLIVVLFVLVINFIFYGSIKSVLSPWLQGFFLGLAILWLIVNVYTFPLLLEQKERSIRMALRNSVVIFMKVPGFSLGLVVFLVALIALSTAIMIPWMLITASLCAFLSSRFLLKALDKIIKEEQKASK